VEHFDAIYPTDKMVKDDNGREYECPLKIGEIGCIMSHRKLWKKIMEMKDDKDKAKWIIVFEDEIQIPKDVEMWQIRTDSDKCNAHTRNIYRYRCGIFRTLLPLFMHPCLRH
jgi:GR25 family glycosyltransferase involved in LPS biosynthesis